MCAWVWGQEGFTEAIMLHNNPPPNSRAYHNKYLFISLTVCKSVGRRGSGLLHGCLIHFGPALPQDIVSWQKAGMQEDKWKHATSLRSWLRTVTAQLPPTWHWPEQLNMAKPGGREICSLPTSGRRCKVIRKGGRCISVSLGQEMENGNNNPHHVGR